MNQSCKYIYIYIQRITMCPHGYHHSGSMATPALGTRDVRFIYIYIFFTPWASLFSQIHIDMTEEFHSHIHSLAYNHSFPSLLHI